MKVLIIDDSRMIKMLVKDYLTKMNCEVVEAENGKEGLVLVEEHNPQLILLDYNMPVMDGPSFLREYKVNRKGSVPVIMMTTENSMEKISEVIGLGASEYLMKPFDDLILKEKIEQVLK